MARAPRLTPQLSEAEQLGRAHLAESGLGPTEIAQLGLTFHSAAETGQLHKNFKPLPSMRIPYWHPLRPTEALTFAPAWPPFYRIRYLKEGKEFADLGEKKPQRYSQEPGSGLCAYFARLPAVDWPQVLANSARPLVITEGEKKAAKACLEGYATIGLGGVHNFRSSKEGVPFLRELLLPNWVKRTVYLIYDSDFRSNQNICRAMNELAEELAQRGALPHLVPLPEVMPAGQKTGLDDFLMSPGGQGMALAQLLHDAAEPLTLAQPLLDLNDQVVLVRDPGLVVELRTQQKLAVAAFRDTAYANVRYAERVVKDSGVVSMKAASAPAAWLKWPLRSEVDCLTYAPGQPTLLRGLSRTDPRSAYNTWSGWACEPRRGDVTPFLELVRHIFTGAEPAAMTWFLRWLAYPIQYPGTKMFSCVAVHGKVHGSGKSLIGYTMREIYGRNFKEIKDEDLHKDFNEWVEGTQFVMGDDVTGSDKRSDNDMLKRLITQKDVRVNIKFIPSYTVPDRINYYFTSNQPDAFFLEDDDRRFMVLEVTVGVKPEVFYVDYTLWLDTEGAPIVHDYLLHLDLGDFNPAAPAFQTMAKHRMTEDARSDLGSWVRKLVVDPDSVLRLGEAILRQDLFTNKELLRLYDPGERTRVTGNGMGRELTRAGVRQVAEGRAVRTRSGLDRVYAVRHPEKWLKADKKTVEAYLLSHQQTPGRY